MKTGQQRSGQGQRRESFTAEHKKLLYDTSRWQAYLHSVRHSATEKSEKDLCEPIRMDKSYEKARATQVTELAESIGRELFGRLYGDPSRLEAPDAPPWMARVHDLLDGLPEWESLRKSVANDPDFSALATRTMLDALAPRLADLIKQDAEEREAAERGEPAQRDPNLPTAEDGARAALRAAAGKAAKDAQETRDALGGLAPGLDATPPADQQAETERYDLIRAVQHDPRFQEIARRAGRIRRISGRAEYRRSRDVYEEVVDVELGSDLTRLLPTEVMYLLDDDLETLELARILDCAATQYRLEGREPQGRGPVIFLRDVSGSMSGDPHVWGAAVGVALSSQAAHERRPMVSTCFNGGICGMRRLDAAGLHDLDRAARLTTTRATGKLAPARAALAHAADGCDGGTSFDPPLRFAFAAGVREPRADFIFLTDGQAYASEEVVRELAELRTAGLRVFGLTVNGGSVSEALAAICDEVVDIDKVSEAETAQRLGRTLRAAR